jgi:hypothetical protein
VGEEGDFENFGICPIGGTCEKKRYEEATPKSNIEVIGLRKIRTSAEERLKRLCEERSNNLWPKTKAGLSIDRRKVLEQIEEQAWAAPGVGKTTEVRDWSDKAERPRSDTETQQSEC